MNNKYLFLFTISSVQSFIAQARKTQDLFAGSRILSELVKEGAIYFETIFKVFSPEAIFPIVDEKDKLASLPNRFIRQISISSDDIQDIDGFLKQNAQNVKERVQRRLEELASEALNGTPKPTGFDEQLSQALNIHWAFQEVKDNNYAQAYEELEKLVGSIKNVRMFEQYHYQTVSNELIIGEKGRKCSLDGENNALFFGEDTNQKYFQLNNLDNTVSQISRVNQNEGLSAVSFVKRFAFDNKGFASTARIALMHNIQKITETKDIDLLNYWLAYKHYFNEQDFDEQLYFEENLREEYFRKNGLRNYLPRLNQITDTHSKISKFLKTKHYALIQFDGDSMGKWLSGDNLKPEYREGEKLKKFHQKFSKLLANFGKHASENILNPTLNNGQTVYAGGDDFLGFINLHHLFDVLKKLRADFDKYVNNELGTYKEIGKHLTFSAGIVIAHYKTPLSEVLKKVREVEKKAKNQGDRNAFAIAVLKHSGEMQECVFKWDSKSDESSSYSNWQDLETVFTMLKNEIFSNKFITNLTTELYDLAGLRLGTLGKVSNTALFAEMKRLLKRGLDGNAKSKVYKLLENDKDFFLQRQIIKQETIINKDTLKASDIIEYFHKRLQEIFKSSQKTKKAETVENFIHALHIADFIHRKI